MPFHARTPGRLGSAVAGEGVTAVNDDDLLFSTEDIERRKRRELPQDWLAQQTDILIARSRAQSAHFKKMLASADPATASRLKKPL